MDALTIYRISHWFFNRRLIYIAKFFQALILLGFNSYIPYEAIIGDGTRLGHRGIGVVINKDATIGKNVLIRAHVTIGKITSEKGAPVIEDNVLIGDGAKILGDIVIGKGSIIGANAVVLHDVAKNTTAVGIPARIIE